MSNSLPRLTTPKIVRLLLQVAAVTICCARFGVASEETWSTPKATPAGAIVLQVAAAEGEDPYLAGVEAASALKKKMVGVPLQAVILSECFEDREYKEKLLQGVCSVLPSDIVLGGSTYGSFHQAGCSDFNSVCLLGIGGEGVSVAASLVCDMGTSKLTFDNDITQLTQRLHSAGAKLADKLRKTDEDRLLILIADAHSPKNQLLVEGAQQVLGTPFPITGGSANKNAGQTFVVFRGKLYQDSAVALMLSGKFNVSLSGRKAKDNDQVIRTARDGAAAALARCKGKPVAALAFNCAGRRGKLDRMEDELAAIQEALGKDLPLFGSYCAGEIGPVDTSERRPGTLSGGSGWHVMFTIITTQAEDTWPVVESFADLPPLERNAMQAQRALAQSHRFTIGWLAKADPESGLIPENLTRGIDRWNGRNNAADNYAFMVLTAALTDRPLFEGRLLDMLRTEQRLTSRIDRLGDYYKFSSRDFEFEKADLDRIIFDNSEYVKDGLMPLTEWLGPSPWSERMSGIIDDIWKHAPVETSAGKIPSTNAEVNGEMMQLTSRYYWMTGQRKYLDDAIRIADWYLLGDRHPTRNSDSLKLRDHGCELISGLTEVYFACSYADQAKAAKYMDPLHEILDSILQHGTDENGMMFNAFNPQTGAITRQGLSDNWGYNYNGFYTVYLVDDVEKYRQAVRRVLGKLDYYEGYAWEGRSHDGYADSIESAINLFNREPIDVAAEWIDSQMRIMLAMQQDDGIIGGWHGDGNFARTAILYALWKQQGVTIQPWREDVRLGALASGGELRLLVAADKPWQGQLIFDAPRHKTVMHMPQDYPRINQFPEWFTVDEHAVYEVAVEAGKREVRTGRELLGGFAVEIASPQEPTCLKVRQAVASDRY